MKSTKITILSAVSLSLMATIAAAQDAEIVVDPAPGQSVIIEDAVPGTDVIVTDNTDASDVETIMVVDPAPVLDDIVVVEPVATVDTVVVVDPEPVAEPVTALVDVTVKRPAVDVNGLPVMDAEGNPVDTYVPVSEDIVVPGDEIRYIVKIDNAGIAVQDLDVTFGIPFETTLIPATISSTVDTQFFVTSELSSEIFVPVFSMQGEERVITAEYQDMSSDTPMNLVARISTVEPAEAAEITYNLIVK